MNVLFICSARSWGGNEKWSVMAAKALADRGHQVHYVARRAFFGPRFGGTPVRFRRMRLAHGLDLGTFVGLVRLIKAGGIDVVLPTKVKEYWLGGLAARCAGAGVAIRLGIVRRLRTFLPGDRLRYGVLPHRIIVNAEAIKRELVKTPWMAADRIRVIYNGVEPLSGPVRRGTLREPHGIAENAFVAIAVGRLTPRKGFDLLIRAFAKAAAGGPARLVLVGDGPQRRALKELARRLGVGDQVVLAGATTRPLPWIADADVLVAPSRQEGLPNTILEAWQVGVPVIATDVAGAAEAIQDGCNGFVVPPEDADALAGRLRELMEKPDVRRRLAEAGTRRLSQRHTLSRMADDLEDVLEEVVGERRASKRPQRVRLGGGRVQGAGPRARASREHGV